MEEFYPSNKIIFNVAKIRRYLLDKDKIHFKEFESVGYTPKDDFKLFKDIEAQFDINKAVFDRKYSSANGFYIIMELGVNESRSFKTCWSLSLYIPIARFVTAYRFGGEKNV